MAGLICNTTLMIALVTERISTALQSVVMGGDVAEPTPRRLSIGATTSFVFFGPPCRCRRWRTFATKHFRVWQGNWSVQGLNAGSEPVLAFFSDLQKEPGGEDVRAAIAQSLMPGAVAGQK